MTALSYAFPSSVFFGAFTPSAPAIIRPAAALLFSGLLSGNDEELGDVGERGLAEYAAGKLVQSVDLLRKCVGEEGVGGGGPGGSFSLLRGVEGRVSASSSEDEACCSQDSTIGVLVWFAVVDGEIERFLRE